MAQSSALRVKFNSSADIPDCSSTPCLHSNQDFQDLLDSLNIQRVDLSFPAISEYPQASQYGLDLVYDLNFQGDQAAVEVLLNNFSFIDYVDEVLEEVPLHTPDDYNLLDNDVGPNWQLNLIEAQDAWTLSKNAHNIKIAILEPGKIDQDHEDLMDVLVEPGTSSITSLHKTFVAGCASVKTNNNIGISSIGYNAKLMDYYGGVNGMIQATADGARVINISMLYSCSPHASTQAAINMLADEGVIIVAAAGNGDLGTSCSDPNGYVYPASYDNVISVSSVGEDNNHYDSVHQGSHTHNDKVSICAPGYSVLSTGPGDNYFRSSGTSFASPIVAGTVALLLNINPCLSFDDILQILQDSADPIDDANNYPPNSLGAGRLNAYQACLLALQSTDVASSIVTGTETWSGDLTVGQDIHIESGGTLTLTGTLKMGPGKRIFVKQGGKLNVDGGKITKADCGDYYWQGIEVWGTTTASQFPMSSTNQGWVKLYNGAEISYAAQGLINWKNNDWNSLGGIIQASFTSFINCRRSAAFMKYQNFDPNTAEHITDFSYFQRCDFINDDNHPFSATDNPPLPMVSLWDVHGVAFQACTFTNSMTTDTYNQRQQGIFSSDADYYVSHQCDDGEYLPPCTEFTRSTFSGFKEAIYARNSSNNAAPRISATDFESNMVGIHFDGVDFGVAVGNQFKLGGLDFDPPSDVFDDAQYHLGIRANSSSNWIIEENVFEKDPAAAGARLVHGVLIEKSGEDNLQLYSNEFTNLEAAVVITGKNASLSNGFDGLRLICNRNENNNGDFQIRLNQAGDYGTISSFQSGNSAASLPGGNTFSAGDGFNTNFVHVDFDSDAHYNFWYDGSAPGQTPDPDEVNVFLGTWDAISTALPNNCPLNYEGVYFMREPNDVKDEFYDVKHDYFNLLYTYEQVLDNGSTEGVLNDIAINWSEDAWELRDELIALSPYLSDSVLLAAADKNLLSHGMLLEVLVANPDGLKNGRVIHHVQCCIANPMPAHMIEILEAANSLQTARTITERSLAGMHGKMLSLQRRILSHYRHDSIPHHPDTLLVWHKENRTLEGRYATAIEYMSRGDFAQAKTALDNAETELNVRGKRRTQLIVMKNFVNLIESAAQDGRSIAQLDSTEQAALVTIAAHSNAGKAGVRAQNALCFFYDNCIDAPAVPKSAPTAQKKKPRPLSALMDEQYGLTCYPNPAREFTQVEFSLVSEGENYAINLYDALGRRVQTQPIGNQLVGVVVLDTRKLIPGVYIVELANQGRKIRSEKLIVQ